MLQFVKGRSKSGKTKYIRDYLSSLANSGDDKLLLIVPDQQTFDTEKAFLNILGPEKVGNVTVVGFRRLCTLVFSKCGFTPANYADNSVKALLMSVALEETSPVLKVFSDKYDSPKLISMLLKLRTEFIRDKVSVSNLTDDTEGFESVLADKLFDTSVVLTAFDAILSASFDDPDGELNVALELIRDNHIFNGYTVAIDSFLSFSSLELDIIEAILNQCNEMLVTLSTDGLNKNDSIFAISADTERHLKDLAQNNVKKAVFCNYDGFFKAKEIKFIEENVFSLKNADDEKINSAYDRENLQIYRASDIYDECDFVARNIRRLVMEDNYRYSDFAVITRDYDGYKVYIENALRNYDVPNFLDSPVNVLSKPLIKMVLAAFDCVLTSFSKDSVLSLIKSGLTNLNEIEIAEFENYIFTWSFSGKSLLNEFTANPDGFSKDFSGSALKKLSAVEKTRKFIMEPLVEFKDAIKDATVREICTALYELVKALGVRERLTRLCEALLSANENRLAEEELRIWEVFVETLNRTVQVVGDRKMKAKRLAELLKLQFINLEIAFIPKSLDEVTVGDVERVRLSDKKVVFVVGAVEGEFPKTEDHSGIFTNNERQILTSKGLLADETLELQYLKERYNCYYALTSASDKLFISFPGTTLQGEINMPSEIVTEVSDLFEEFTADSAESVDVFDKLWSKTASFDILASRLSGTDELTEILKNYYRESEDFTSSLYAIDRARFCSTNKSISKTHADELYGNDMNLSASQVEKFFSCKFSYFCNYGLKLKERARAEMSGMVYGNLIHSILEHFISNISKSEMKTITDAEIELKVSEIVDDYVKETFGGLSDKTHRFRYLVERTKGIASKLVRHILNELVQSEFVPDAFELEIGSDEVPHYTIELDNGDKLIVGGKVDRADVYEKDGQHYIRIIDYKTGVVEFSLGNVLAGLSLQMLIYLSVLCRAKSKRYPYDLVPAGVLYVPSTVPVVSAAKDEKIEKVKDKYLKALCMNGLIVDDEQIVRAMEKDANGVYIPVSIKNGSLSGEDSLATLQEFGSIFSKLDELLVSMVKELKDGDASAVPVSGNNNDPCKYCKFKSFCGFSEGDNTRVVSALSKDDFIKELNSRESEVCDIEQKLDC